MVESPQNTFVFNHFMLAAASTAPHVLAVKDGGYFQVRFVCTDPAKFNYTITASADAQPKSATQDVADHVETTDLSRSASVTMRHSRLFARYRVEIALRDDLKRPSGQEATDARRGVRPPMRLRNEPSQDTYTLYSTAFDLWVETTPEWTVDFSGGIAFTGLRGHEYFIRTDTKNTPGTNDDIKTVEEDVAARGSFRPDIIALANIRHPRAKGVGAAFGVGLNNDADPRYFLGVSYLLGGKFIFNTGWAGGKVNELPAGQELHKPPINGDNTLTTPVGRFRNAFYVGIAFTFIDRQDQFKGAFTATQHTSYEEQTPLAATASRQDFAGIYTAAGEPDAAIDQQGDVLTLTLNASPTGEPLTPDHDLQFHVGTDTTRVVTFVLDESRRIRSLEYHARGKTVTYVKRGA